MWTMEVVNQWAIPFLILGILLAAARRGVPMYESFVTGAKEGFNVAVTIIPYLVAMLFVIGLLVSSGFFEDVKNILAYGLTAVGFGSLAESLELLPLAFTRPLSGTGARSVLIEIFEEHGPDGFLGKTASIMQGSTETTFYILTVYYGSVGIKKIRHTLPACLIADVAAMIAALALGIALYSS
ncbi:spore maturation protein [Aeoliella mucimassa]|uniref:Spore maturation protein B n=1 Tax=Aeoliella mucimassa TaxID=2527972 RepID=A0A518AS87_9BACT|nr:nucleoside recognition domain-containing protein [Aeoliella mucimassa]QDU57585.1 Spore maturation protein B [Aeoliella mucimassa]